MRRDVALRGHARGGEIILLVWMDGYHVLLQNVPCGGVDVLVVSSVNGHEKGRTTSIAAVHIMITSRIVGGRRVGRRWMEQVGSRRP